MTDGRGEHRFSVHAMTDVTGFGLMGHSREMALASGVSLRIQANRLAVLPGALECIRAGHIPGGLTANRDFAECVVGYETAIADETKTLLFDPQTAGGLLISIAPEASLRNSSPIHRTGGRDRQASAAGALLIGSVDGTSGTRAAAHSGIY